MDPTEIFERNRLALGRFVRRRAAALRCLRESVSDLLQSTFREFAQERDELEGRDEEVQRQWLYRTAECKLRNRARYWRAQRRESLREQGLAQGQDFARDQRLPARETDLSPSEQISLQETAESIERGLARLPAEYREVIRLVRMEERSFAEVAARMNRSEVAVRKLLSRALARLVEELQGRDLPAKS